MEESFFVSESPGLRHHRCAVHGAAVDDTRRDAGERLVLQHEVNSDGGPVPLVIMTHETTEGAAAKACQKINDLDCVCGSAVRMWVRD